MGRVRWVLPLGGVGMVMLSVAYSQASSEVPTPTPAFDEAPCAEEVEAPAERPLATRSEAPSAGVPLTPEEVEAAEAAPPQDAPEAQPDEAPCGGASLEELPLEGVENLVESVVCTDALEPPPALDGSAPETARPDTNE